MEQVVTRNQQRAVLLADRILKGHVDPAELSEVDWSLLLLAAGLYKVATPPRVVALRVLANAEHLEGYFTGTISVQLSDVLHASMGNSKSPLFH